MPLALVRSYVQTLQRACDIIASQCPATPLEEGHAATLEDIADVLARVKLRMWFLRADQLLQSGSDMRAGHAAPEG